jgi:hypothetical protein
MVLNTIGPWTLWLWETTPALRRAGVRGGYQVARVRPAPDGRAWTWSTYLYPEQPQTSTDLQNAVDAADAKLGLLPRSPEDAALLAATLTSYLAEIQRLQEREPASRPAVRGNLRCQLTDPLDDARSLLTLCRLIYRARVSGELLGVEPAPEAARALLPVGRRLAAAVEAAEECASDESRAVALEEVALAGEALAGTIDERWEGIRALLAVALAGVRAQCVVPAG